MTAREQEEFIGIVVRGLSPLLNEWTERMEARVRAMEAQLATGSAITSLPPVTPAPSKPLVKHRGPWVADRVYAPNDGVLFEGKAFIATREHVGAPPGNPMTGSWWRRAEREP